MKRFFYLFSFVGFLLLFCICPSLEAGETARSSAAFGRSDKVYDLGLDGQRWGPVIEELIRDKPYLPWARERVGLLLNQCTDGAVSACVELGLAYETINAEFPQAGLVRCLTPDIYELACRRGAPAGCYLSAWYARFGHCSRIGFGASRDTVIAGCTLTSEDSLMWSARRGLATRYLDDFDQICFSVPGASELTTHGSAQYIIRDAREQVKRGGAKYTRGTNVAPSLVALDRELIATIARAGGGETGGASFNRAGAYGAPRSVMALITLGANPNAMDREGNTALMIAVRYKNVDAVRDLLATGADITMTDSGENTALHLAAMQGGADTRVLNELVVRYQDVNIKNSYGDTPLMSAVRRGNIWAVRRLLDLGALTSVTNNFNETALSLSRQGQRDNESRWVIKNRYMDIESILRTSVR